MPIIRSQLDFEKREFTQIPNSWVRDQRLSLKSKGLLTQLLSHTPGWKMTISSLAKANNCGYHTIASAIQELETAGYLKRVQKKSDNGQFGEMIWFTVSPGEPFVENPTSENPTPDNHLHKKTKEKKTKEKNTNTSAFDEFWGLYPRKAGKASARKSFDLLSDESRTQAMEGVRRLLEDPNLPPTQYIPHPATWLNREGWEDEAHPVRESATSQPVVAKSPYVGAPREWVKNLHDIGEHYECQPGEFGH